MRYRHVNIFQLVAVFLRSITLATRLGLMFYLANKLSVYHMGVFGLYWAGLQLSSSLAPLDVYAQTTRLLLSKGSDWSLLLKKHFGFLSISVFLFSPLAIYLNIKFGSGLEGFLLMLFIIHFPLEVFATDIGRLLIPLGHPLASTIVLFIRSALWFYPLVIVFEVFSFGDQLVAIVLAWTIGSFCAVLWGFWVLKKEVLKNFSPAFDISWIKSAVLGSCLFLLASLIFRILLGVDRFVINAFFDEEVVAIYALYVSVSLGVLALIETGVSAWCYPGLVSEIKNKNRQGVFRLFREFLLKNTLSTLILFAFLVSIFPYATSIFLPPEYVDNISVFYVIALGAFFYCISMPFHYLIYGFSKDYFLILVYSFSLVFMMIWAYLFMADFGALGAGLLLLVTLFAIFLLRLIFSLKLLFGTK